MDVWEARFTQTQVATATGVQRNRLTMWLTRGYVRYAEADGDRESASGLGHRISARTALRVAVIDALSPFVDPSKAERAVLKFMDGGTGPTPEGSCGRSPGELFEEGETVLVVFDDGDAEVVCVRVEDSALQLPGIRTGRRAVVVPLNELHATVLHRLERLMPAGASTTPSNLAAERRKTVAS